MIDSMFYGIIVIHDSFDMLIELREMVEAGIMRLASAKYNEEDGRVLEQLLDQMRGIVRGDGQDKVERFFAVDNQFHDMVSQMGKNPLADKISLVVCSLTHVVRYELFCSKIITGRGEELLEAHSDLFETLRSRRQDNVEEIVRATYFKAALYGQEKN